jgi:hypothetical protein
MSGITIVYMDFVLNGDGEYDKIALGQVRESEFAYGRNMAERECLISLLVYIRDVIYKFSSPDIEFLGMTANDTIPTSEIALIPTLLAYRASKSAHSDVGHAAFRAGPKPLTGVDRCIVIDTRMLWQKGPKQVDIDAGEAGKWKLGDEYDTYPHCPLLFNADLPWSEMWDHTGMPDGKSKKEEYTPVV